MTGWGAIAKGILTPIGKAMTKIFFGPVSVLLMTPGTDLQMGLKTLRMNRYNMPQDRIAKRLGPPAKGRVEPFSQNAHMGKLTK